MLRFDNQKIGKHAHNVNTLDAELFRAHYLPAIIATNGGFYVKITSFIAALALGAMVALGASSIVFAADSLDTGKPPGITDCLDICALPSVDPFDAPACDVLGVVAMTACIPDLSINVADWATSAAEGGGLDPGGGQFVAPLLKIPTGLARGAYRVRIDPGRTIYV